MESGRTSELLEVCGRAVQEGWRKEALKMPNAPDSWKRGYDEVTEKMKRMDRNIGVNVLREALQWAMKQNISVPQFIRLLSEVSKNGEESL